MKARLVNLRELAQKAYKKRQVKMKRIGEQEQKKEKEKENKHLN